MLGDTKTGEKMGLWRFPQGVDSCVVVAASRTRRDSLISFAGLKGQPLTQQQSPGLVCVLVEQRSPSSEICQFRVEMKEWGRGKAEEPGRLSEQGYILNQSKRVPGLGWSGPVDTCTRHAP